jgi:LacI family transcriptional regulator
MRDAGMKPRDGWIARGGFMDGDGYSAMQQLLRLRPRIDAVFAGNDPAAIGAMRAIWEAGLSVPDDIAIVGAGDIAHGDLLRVPLTTVGWAKEEQGRRAAELIFDQISGHGRTTFQRVILPPRLIVRASCGAQPAAPPPPAASASTSRKPQAQRRTAKS